MADDKDQLEGNEDEDDDEESDEGGDGGDGKKKPGLKKILIIVVPLLLIVGGGAGAYFMGYLDSLLGVEASEEEVAEEGDDSGKGDKKKKKEKDGYAKKSDGYDEGGGSGTAFIEIPAMIVNLSTEDGTPRYLRLTVQLELEDSGEKEAVEAVIPRVIDQFQTYLRELRVRDLRGSAGIYRLQMELLWRVNQAAYPVEIKDVLFQEILIQ